MGMNGSVGKGYDHAYHLRQVSAGVDAEQQKGAGYYLAATEAGEPPGRWWGAGAQVLGLEAGSEVEKGPHELMFAERKGPDGQKLGRGPGKGADRAREAYERMLAAEPHADRCRQRHLRLEAQREARQSPQYFDITMSPSKSISVFHASLGENVRQALMRGDTQTAAKYAAMVDELDAMIAAANDAALSYIQREAGYVRTGTHNARVDGIESGSWAEADLAVASWFQHTSRDGDMQLHTHNQILHAARTRADGKWRAPDSRLYYREVHAAAGIAAVHLEEAMSRRFGIQWTERPDGLGYEIAGVSQQAMDVFSSRREAIDERMAGQLVPEFEREYGRKPSQAELASLRQEANLATRSHKPEGRIEWDQTRAGWAAKLARRAGADLGQIARDVLREAQGAGARDTEADAQPDVARAAHKAMARMEAAKATWTRADLLAQVGRALPRTGADPDAQAALAEQVADRIIAGEFGTVSCLEAPEVVAVPASLRRADGQSVYTQPGAARYATGEQIAAEERLAELAQAQCEPLMSPEAAANALGSTVEQLNDALEGRVQDAAAQNTSKGYRLDHAAAAFHVATATTRAVVINAAAGAGKTTTAGILAEILPGPVVGITPSQAARNTLAEVIPESYNFAQFLGHLPGERGALGAVPVRPGTAAVHDEASMLGTRDMVDTLELLEAVDGRAILAGDTGQLAAVEHGGGMSLVARVLGYAQLAEPVRFRAGWEKAASVRLRNGDASVLAEYADHGRLRAGSLEDMLEAAASAYVARTLEGQDALLVVRDHASRRELSRRIRGELRHLGRVSAGPEARIADGQRVSAGDLVVCTSNDGRVLTMPGRRLANGDLLRVESVGPDGRLELRKAIDADRETGERRFASRSFTYRDGSRFEPGYAVTAHAAQSRTVRSGLELITGSEDRQGAYVGMSRGTDENLAFIVTPSPKEADPLPGSRPAPELARYARLQAEREGGERVEADFSEPDLDEGIAVFAGVLERDGAELSALEYRQRQLANADHLGLLYPIWQAEMWQAHAQRYRDMVMAELPAGYDGELSHQSRWLFRTMRSAELAGLDPQQVVRQAVAAGSLDGSRDVASVVDSRIRREAGALVPLTPAAWTEQVPETGDRERQEFISEIANVMHERRERIGQHAADAALPWATKELGPVPEDPLDRLEWQKRASAVGAYMEIFGHSGDGGLIGPEPAAGESPDKRAMWHEAFRALAPVDDVRFLEDRQLWLRRDTYQVETAWAPRYVGGILGSVRRSAADAHMSAVRAEASASVADNEATAAAFRQKAERSRQLEHGYRLQEGLLGKAMQDWEEWRSSTEQQRLGAVACDSELRHRYPDRHIEPLRSAEPAAPSDSERAEAARGGMPAWIAELEEGSRRHAERMQERAGLMIPAEDPDLEPEGEAFPVTRAAFRDAILQPPPPEMPASPRVAQGMGERRREMAASKDGFALELNWLSRSRSCRQLGRCQRTAWLARCSWASSGWMAESGRCRGSCRRLPRRPERASAWR
jgi:conjugative relaxase-like TrwC/TraI family protein